MKSREGGKGKEKKNIPSKKEGVRVQTTRHTDIKVIPDFTGITVDKSNRQRSLPSINCLEGWKIRKEGRGRKKEKKKKETNNVSFGDESVGRPLRLVNSPPIIINTS